MTYGLGMSDTRDQPMTIQIHYANASTSKKSPQIPSLCCRSMQFEKQPMYVSRTGRKYSSITCSRCGAIAGVVDETLISAIEGIKVALKRLADAMPD